MKCTEDELQRWYEGGADGRSFQWFKMDTRPVQNMDDKELLCRITQLPVTDISGWGLVAELCKRFNVL